MKRIYTITLAISVLLLVSGNLVAQNTYTNYSASWNFCDFVAVNCGSGGGSVSASISNDILTITFSGGFASGYMYQGKIKQLSTSPTLPNMELGYVTMNYKASIDGGWLRIDGSGESVTGFSRTFTVDLKKLQRLNLNYVTTYEACSALSNILTSYEYTNLPFLVKEDVQYFDGLGRPTQTIQKKGNSDYNKDIISMVEYDAFGREWKEYLPYATTSTSDGFYNPNAKTEQDAFYDALKGGSEGSYAFAETEYELSALNRPVESASPGSAWRMGTANTREISYQTNNVSDGIKYLITNPDGSIVIGNVFNTGELYLTVSDDENTGTAEGEVWDYTDKLGRKIIRMLRADASNTFAKTFYIHDHFGQLRHVVQPMGVAEIESTGNYNLLNDESFRKKWVFSYDYDSRKRVIAKRTPGADWTYIIYDKRDRVVLTQTGNERRFDRVNGTESLDFYDGKSYLIESGSLTMKPGFSFSASTSNSFIASTNSATFTGSDTWIFTKYDHLNRPVVTGYYRDNRDRATIQNEANGIGDFSEDYTGTGSLEGYNNSSYPTTGVGSADVLSVTYYDTYGFSDDTNHWGLGNYTASPAKKGLSTGAKTRILGGGLLESVNLYDSRNRILQSVSENPLSGTDVVDTQYNSIVSNVVTKTTRSHTSSKYTGTLTLIDQFTYDYRDRLKSVSHQIGTNVANKVTLATLAYNDIGELTTRKLHFLGGSNYLQTVDYKYNMRGWLSTINGGTTFNDPTDLFGMELQYDVAGQYNGNVGKMNWKTVQGTGIAAAAQSYTFSYDRLNRLTQAIYNTGISGAGHFDEKGISYDLNGNILTLIRNYQGTGSPADNLDYDYTGNQLTTVGDSGPNTLFDEADSDGKGLNEYVYDANGNMTRDRNKGITSIKYNYLNLPEQVTTSDGVVYYTYTAGGVKVRKFFDSATGSDKTTDYLSGIQYTDNGLDFIQHAEGRARYTGSTFSYEYNLSDHLGNVRATVDVSGTVIQRDDYYPFGLAFHTQTPSSANLYKYNGKEEQEETKWYDYGARMYMADLGRWGVVDPFADQMRRFTPYNYSFNNPARFIDPDGMMPLSAEFLETASYDYYDYSGSGEADGGVTGNETNRQQGPESTQGGKEPSHPSGRTAEECPYCQRVELLNSVWDWGKKVVEYFEKQASNWKAVPVDEPQIDDVPQDSNPDGNPEFNPNANANGNSKDSGKIHTHENGMRNTTNFDKNHGIGMVKPGGDRPAGIINEGTHPVNDSTEAHGVWISLGGGLWQLIKSDTTQIE